VPDARSETVRRRECSLEQCQRRRKPIACTAIATDSALKVSLALVRRVQIGRPFSGLPPLAAHGS
jgi:hypothetical protein